MSQTGSCSYGGIIAASDITCLRSALSFLSSAPGLLVEVDAPVSPYCEMARLYHRMARGRTLVFRNVAGFQMPAVAGVLASRSHAALLLGSEVDRLPFDLLEALNRRLPPIEIADAPCQEVVLRPPFDLRKLLPAPVHTEQDAGAFLTAGLLRASDPETGEADVTIHRMCLQGPDTLSVYFVSGRRIDRFRQKAERAGQPLPISISIGLDPAVYLAACVGPPLAPAAEDELAIAGGIRRRAVELVNCLSVSAHALASAEIVIEGEILPDVRVAEDALTGSGYSMPEFHGYMGTAEAQVPVIKASAVTHRRDPIFQTIIGPAQDRTQLVGIPTEAAIIKLLNEVTPGLLQSVYAHPSGGGTLLAILQISKTSDEDDRRARQAGLACLESFHQLKDVVLVDKDVDLFDSDDLLWAITTRCEGRTGRIFTTGAALRILGSTERTLHDCTLKWDQKDRLRRPCFS